MLSKNGDIDVVESSDENKAEEKAEELFINKLIKSIDNDYNMMN